MMKSLPEIRNSILKQIKEKISCMLTKIKSSLLLINLNFQVSACILFIPLRLLNCYEGTSLQLYRLHNFCSYEKKAWKKLGLYKHSTSISEFKGSNTIQAWIIFTAAKVANITVMKYIIIFMYIHNFIIILSQVYNETNSTAYSQLAC